MTRVFRREDEVARTAGSGFLNSGPAVCPVELLHPDGPVRERAVLGRNCPVFFCSGPLGAPTAPLDLLIVAPDRWECRDADFLKDASALAGALSADGLAYVIASAGWRRRLHRSLHGADFVFGPTLAHLPFRGPDQYLVPTERHLMRYTVAALMGLTPLRRRILGGALQMPCIEGIIARLSTVGTVVRRAGARPLLQWLATDDHQVANAVIRTKWRAQGGTAVLHGFTGLKSTPTIVGKVALSDGLVSRTEREAEALRVLGPTAARAGIRVPRGDLVRCGTGRPVLLEHYLDGQRAATLLQAGAIDALDLLRRLTAWLKEWNRSTRVTQVLDQRQFEAELLSPVMHVAPLLRSGPRYVDWLRELGRSALGASMPWVAAHNDLTMQNVLLDAASPPAVLDWEAAVQLGMPLADFFYSAVDIFAAANRDADRQQAFSTCFDGRSPVADLVARLGEEIMQAVQLPPALVPICFHGCWIQHSVNELRKKPTGGARPFLAILEWLAAHPGDVRLPGGR